MDEVLGEELRREVHGIVAALYALSVLQKPIDQLIIKMIFFLKNTRGKRKEK